ncbi:MAG: amino acid adenylation domain-containing protein [Acidobacteria bacterium]|nr:MAG: amino acid adenylation domain-containing protein [Acidobacteriota bacterium]
MPDRTAIVDGGRRVTFAELEDRARRLAGLLARHGGGPGQRVGLLSGKSIDAIAAMVGASRAGMPYVPLDPASPAPRLARIVGRCRPRLVLVEKAAWPRALELVAECSRDGPAPLLALIDGPAPAGADVAFDGPAAVTAPPADTPSPATADAPAHILFTSGSTGVPKGVVVPHRSVIAFVEWANRQFGARPGERVSGHSPLHFDLSSWDIWGALAAGCELHLVAPRLNLNPARLAQFIRDRRLERWFSVPSVLSYMVRFDVVRENDFPELRRLLWCGEVFPTPALRALMSRLPHVEFTNLYGPTETTIASSWHTVERIPAADTDDVPIGRACGGEELLVLRDDGTPAAPGETGELCIGGDGLTLGYWDDPETTARAFVTVDPGDGRGARTFYRTGDLAHIDEHGVAWFHGRRDHQIKSRGYRIELGEIETALHALDELAESAVVAVPTGGFEGHAICCAYVPARPDIGPVELRRALSGMIPPYMIPARWLALEALPKTGNGKIDRRSLRERFEREQP